MKEVTIIFKHRGRYPINNKPSQVRTALSWDKSASQNGRRWAVAVLTGLALGFSCLDSSGNPLPVIRTVALSDDQPPSAAPDVSYKGFTGPPVINNAGQTAFYAQLADPSLGVESVRGIYSETDGTLNLVARNNTPIPDNEPGLRFGQVYEAPPVINDIGQVVFYTTLRGPGVDLTTNESIYKYSDSTFTQVVREYQPFPGEETSMLVHSFSLPVLNNAGQTAFRGTLTDANPANVYSSGIFKELGGTFVTVAREGQHPPGADPDVVFDYLFGNPVINNAGQTAFLAYLTRDGVLISTDSAIYSEASGSLAQIARNGQPAPGTEPGVLFSRFDTPVINNAGQTAFLAFLTGAGVDDTNNSIIYSEGGGTLAPVAREGQQAPGAEQGVLFSGVALPVINGAGQTTFLGFLRGSGVNDANRIGIYNDSNGSLSQVARTGQQAPDAEPGVLFSDFDRSGLVINGAGQIAFMGKLTGADIDNSNNVGIYATHTDGRLVQIVREGQTFDVNNDPLIDDLRTVALLALLVNSGNQDGRGSGFNDLGQLAFRATFTDGTSGIFVSNLVATSQALPGDLNGDGFVGIADLMSILDNWNQNVTPGDKLLGDPSGDGFVGIQDLNSVLGNWNTGIPPTSSAVPEPVSMVWILGGWSLLVTTTRSHRFKTL